MEILSLLAWLSLALGFVWYILPIIINESEQWLREDVTPSGHVHKWKYGKLEVPFEDKNRTIKFPQRECTKCGQKQYRTMLPSCNGVDNLNKWKNYKGELKMTRVEW